MEVPEKVYLYLSDRAGEDYDNEWGTVPLGKDSIEYRCTNTFIEKAWDWIEDNILSSNQQDKSLLYYEQFKKHLKK